MLFLAPSGAPENVTSESVSSRSVEVRWNPPQAHHRNGPITAYNVTVIIQSTGTQQFTLLVSNSTSLIVNSLRPCTTYDFTVIARNSIGYGPPFTVPHTTPEDSKNLVIGEFMLEIQL